MNWYVNRCVWSLEFRRRSFTLSTFGYKFFYRRFIASSRRVFGKTVFNAFSECPRNPYTRASGIFRDTRHHNITLTSATTTQVWRTNRPAPPPPPTPDGTHAQCYYNTIKRAYMIFSPTTPRRYVIRFRTRIGLYRFSIIIIIIIVMVCFVWRFDRNVREPAQYVSHAIVSRNTTRLCFCARSKNVKSRLRRQRVSYGFPAASWRSTGPDRYWRPTPRLFSDRLWAKLKQRGLCTH